MFGERFLHNPSVRRVLGAGIDLGFLLGAFIGAVLLRFAYPLSEITRYDSIAAKSLFLHQDPVAPAGC